MPTQSHLKHRLFIVVSVVVFLLIALVAFKVIKPYFEGKVVPSSVVENPEDRGPGKDHPIAAPTDVYVASNAPIIEVDANLNYTDVEVSVRRITLFYILQDGDLLASHCLKGCRAFVTEQQVLEAQLLTKEFDAQLKEVRRQRAEVLEQAGVTIDDPEEELARIRVKAFSVYSEARDRIFHEVLTAEQRKAIHENFLRKKEEVRRVQEEANQAAEKTGVSKTKAWEAKVSK